MNRLTFYDLERENITFRTKFKKQIPENLMRKVEKETRIFLGKNDYQALWILWRLMVKPKESMQKIGFIVEEDGLEKSATNVVSLNFVNSFRKELSYQRYLQNKDFPKNMLYREIPKECQEAYDKLYNQTGNDIVVTVIVVNACFKAVFNGEDVDRTLYLLRSDKTNYIAGGIGNLKFKKAEIAYLLQFAKNIYDFLFDLVKTERQKEEFSKKENEAKSQPKEMSDDEKKMLEENDCHSRDDYSIFLGKILENRTLIEQYFDLHNKLQEKGLNPQEILENMENIKAFFAITENIHVRNYNS